MGRADNAAAYDPIHDRMIFYGGWSGTDMLSDTQFLDWASSSVEAALTPGASATPTAVHVDWNVQSATGTHAAIYRRDTGGQWTARAQGEVGANGHLVYDDPSVQSGNAYSYMMVVASQRNLKNGFFWQKQGVEYTFTLLGVAVALFFAGPGAYSLDAALGLKLL